MLVGCNSVRLAFFVLKDLFAWLGVCDKVRLAFNYFIKTTLATRCFRRRKKEKREEEEEEQEEKSSSSPCFCFSHGFAASSHPRCNWGVCSTSGQGNSVFCGPSLATWPIIFDLVSSGRNSLRRRLEAGQAERVICRLDGGPK